MLHVTVFAGDSLGLPMHVFGTETHMTAIVGMALGKREIPNEVGFDSNAAANMFFTAQNKVRTCTLCCILFIFLLIDFQLILSTLGLLSTETSQSTKN